MAALIRSQHARPNRARAPIITLPLEIFYQFSEIKSFRESLLNLRLTCRKLNRRLRDLHLGHIYDTQTIFLTPIFLQNLLEISRRHPGPHLRARHIIISSSVPHVTKVRGAQNLQRGVQDDTESTAVVPNFSEANPHTFVRMECLAYDHTTSMHQIRDGRHSPPVNLLALVLSSFPHAQSILFQGHHPQPLSSFELDTFYPSLEFGPSNPASAVLRKCATDWLHQAEDFSMIWWTVMHSLQLFDSKKIQTIKMDERLKREPYLLGDQKVIGIDLSRFHTVSKEPSALNIRELDVCSIPMTYSNENCERFSKWLGTIGPRLEYLNLDLNRPERFLLPTSLKLSNLKALRISYATIDFNNFKAFLNHSRLTLETLILERFEFVNNNPERCFQFLKYARQTLFNLKFLMMDITTKLHDPYFGIYMTTHGWGPASIANGGIEHSHKYASFFLQNLAAQIDANYQPEDLWDSLANLRTQDYSGALRINHYDGVDYDFDSEDDEDDRDYVYNPFRRHEEDDDDGTLGDGDGDDSDYENEAWNYETDDELEYWSDYESD